LEAGIHNSYSKQLFEHVFEQLQSTPELGQNPDGCGRTAAHRAGWSHEFQ
jgi:hypothetical protein